MVRLTFREKTTDIDAESINVAAHHIGEVLIDGAIRPGDRIKIGFFPQ